MTNSTPHLYDSANDLGRWAEEQLKTILADQRPITPEEVQRLLHELQVYQTEMEMQNDKLRRTQEELETFRSKYVDLFDLAPIGYLTLNEDGLIMEANLRAVLLFGLDRNHLVQQSLSRFVIREDQDIYYQHHKHLILAGERQVCELRMTRQDSSQFWVRLEAIAVEHEREDLRYRVAMSDITEYKFQEDERDLTARLILQVNTPGDIRENISALTASLQGWSGCEAVGIRLRAGDEYPYYETRGYSPAYVHQENNICAYGPDGKILRDSEGNPVFDGIYNNILSGQFDSSKPYFTTHGSFWSNNTTTLLASTITDLEARMLNRCRGEGYESVALIPLRTGQQVFGLLQFNDRHQDRFTPALIAHFERMAVSLAIALSRRQAVETLRENQARQSAMIANIADVITIIDLDGISKYKSPNIEKWFGWCAEELVGISAWENIHAEDTKRVQEFFSELQHEPDSTGAVEYRYRCKDGNYKWVEFIGFNLLHNPDIQGILGNFHDSTKRKQAEKALRESETRYRRITEGLTDYLYSVHVENGCAVETMQSTACETVTGYTAMEFTTDPSLWIRVVAPQDQELVNKRIQQILMGQESPPIEYRIQHKDGSIRWVVDTNILFKDPSGKLLSYDGVVKDITERKRQEHELEHYQEHLEMLVEERTNELLQARDSANAANQVKSMFLANMSHEIRTPMNAVLGFAQLLERDPSLSPMARHKVATIMKSGEHLLSIINDILEMSRIEAGRVELNNQSLDLFTLLEDLAVMFRLRAEEKKLSFTLDFAKDLPRYIVADLGKLRQVLINLLGNAVKFTKQGFIILRSLSAGNDRIAIEVQDTGIGISPAEQEKLFHPFERTHSGEQAAGGTGLGLAISLKYAHLMGGEISVKSQVSEGSCFRFEFLAPMTSVLPVSEKATRRVIALAPGQGNIRVLVVDDQSTNRELLRGMLEPLGFIVDEACDGENAIIMANFNLPRIILIDLVMPVMNGIEATQILRKTCLSESTAIIGISASVFEEVKQNFLKAGINAFIAKPFREQDLFEILTRHAGVEFETEAIRSETPNIPINIEKPTLKKMSAAWCEAFNEALTQGNITRIRNLGEDVKEIDPHLSLWILEKTNRYDLHGLKNLRNGNE